MCCGTESHCGEFHAGFGIHSHGCFHSTPFPGFMSKKRKIEMLERYLENLHEQENETEELLAELKAE